MTESSRLPTDGLAWRSLTLFERLAAHESETAPTDCESAEAFLDAWMDRFEDESAFRRRLAAESLSEHDCREIACRNAPPENGPTTAADFVENLVAFVEGYQEPGEASDGSFPFGGVLEPWIAFAEEELSGEVDPPDGFRTWLREQLLEVAAKPLVVEFRTFVAMRDPDRLSAEVESPGDEHYRAFVEWARSADGLRTVFEDYPVLARHVATIVRQWDAAVSEFHERLAADRQQLSETFADDDLGDLAAVEAVTDDRHADGRAVFRVTFESGVEVAYKPRPVDAGRAFADFLGWLGDRWDLPAFELPAYVARGDYGWMEWITRTDCGSRTAVERFYRRAGALVAVAYALGLTDVQFENLVAWGDQPVVVDAETIMQPYVDDGDDGSRELLVATELRDSVLASRLLPWRAGDRADVDTSGLGAAAVEMLVPVWDPKRWTRPNTDDLALETGVFEAETGRNRPLLDGTPQDPDDYVDEVLDGFETAYRRLHADRDRLLDDGGPLKRFADVETRYIHASTDQYYTVLRALASPGCQEDGLELTQRVEKLAASRFRDGDSESLSLYHRERTALERLDVPRFGTTPTSRAITHDGESIPDFLAAPGLQRVRERIRALDPKEVLPTQKDYVRMSLGTAPELADPGDADVPSGVDATDAKSLDDYLLDRAWDVYEDVRDRARSTGNGHTAWLLRAVYENDAPMSLRTLDDSLYEGQAGVALFFAALHAVDGAPGPRQLALDALAPLRERVRSGGETFEAAGVGGADAGAGSAVYALRTAGVLLDEQSLLEDARQAARRITPELIERDDDLDVVSGAAGATLSLLALYDTCREDWLLDRAAACGDHLLDRRVTTEVGQRAWEASADDNVLAGFAHGAGGIAYALARLADATGDERYAAAAAEGFAFEDAIYDPDHGNWPDRRYDEDVFMDAWCHGRTGVGIARLAALGHVGEDAVEPGLSRAIEGRRSDRLGELDNLCCGNAGRVEFLLAAAESLEESTYREQARSLAAAIAGRADERGRFSLQSHTANLYDPTLFQGTTGVGYATLRARRPDLVPAVVRWE